MGEGIEDEAPAPPAPAAAAVATEVERLAGGRSIIPPCEVVALIPVCFLVFDRVITALPRLPVPLASGSKAAVGLGVMNGDDDAGPVPALVPAVVVVCGR